jgi:hypothetical protein
MSIAVEMNLRIPRVKEPVRDENGYPIDNGSVRFTKMTTVPSIPKPGTLMTMTTSAGHTFGCEVTRADWNEERALFIVSCKYANRSIPADECTALFNDAEWRVKPLL